MGRRWHRSGHIWAIFRLTCAAQSPPHRWLTDRELLGQRRHGLPLGVALRDDPALLACTRCGSVRFLRLGIRKPIDLVLRPNATPSSRARRMPAWVRAVIRLRSNSAKPPSTVNSSLPCGVVVSHQWSARERNCNQPMLAVVRDQFASLGAITSTYPFIDDKRRLSGHPRMLAQLSRRSLLGHQDAFLRPRLSARYRLRRYVRVLRPAARPDVR